MLSMSKWPAYRLSNLVIMGPPRRLLSQSSGSRRVRSARSATPSAHAAGPTWEGWGKAFRDGLIRWGPRHGPHTPQTPQRLLEQLQVDRVAHRAVAPIAR